MVIGGYHMVTWKDVWLEIKWQWYFKTKPLKLKIVTLMEAIYNKFKRE
jgi:hypothetical protein